MKLEELKDEKVYTTRQDKQRRGYEFEKYLFDQFEKEDIFVKRPFKGRGEQVDGGIFFNGSWYLVEAKWHSKELPVSEVYSFKGKVDGKLTGTKGVFISWSGYSNECADALSMGKELNVILCNSLDVEAAEKVGWSEVLRHKLMFASLYGEVYAPERLLEAIQTSSNEPPKVQFFVEGETDAQFFSTLTGRLGLSSNVSFLPCGGKMSAMKLASQLPPLEDTKRVLIIDSDGNPNIEEQVDKLNLVDASIVIDNEIESLLFPDSDTPRQDLKMKAKVLSENPTKLMLGLIDQVIEENPQEIIDKLKQILLGKDS